jgi:quinol monooxygenase YgiN
MYIHRVSIYPKPEKVEEVRTLFVERIKRRQTEGARAEFVELVFGDNSPQFTVSTLYEDMAAFEVAQQGYRSDPGAQNFLAKIEPLIREPLAGDLLEVLMPMPR